MSVESVEGECAMILPMNEWEITLGILCQACSLLATHCDSEVTDCPLFLCNAHAFRQAMTHGGTVRANLWNDNATIALFDSRLHRQSIPARASNIMLMLGSGSSD